MEHIALHGRTREQGYRGLANWDLVREIKKVVRVPVSGSGDVATIPYLLDVSRDEVRVVVDGHQISLRCNVECETS